MFAKVYRLERSQFLPVSREQCWEFFSKPQNLPRITPPWLGFDLGDLAEEVVRPGHIFQYRVRPICGFPIPWVTEITHLVEPELFVDEQRFGSYRFWHHQHLFYALLGGTEIVDIVNYSLTLGLLERLGPQYPVYEQLAAIFHYCASQLDNILV